MNKYIISSVGSVALGSGVLFTLSQLFASDSVTTTEQKPPEYPEKCDTTALPKGFQFPELKSELPYDLGSLKSGAEVQSSTSQECDVFETQKMFDLFSWQAFVGLNWPADDQGNPLSGKIGSSPDSQRVWETYLSPSQIFKEGGATPDKWGTPESERGLIATSKHTHILDEVDEAFFNLETAMPPITDLNNAYVRYEIRINEEEYNYLVGEKLYSVAGQKEFIKNKKTVSFPEGTLSPTPSYGAMELKVAWKKMGAGDDPSKFHTITPIVEQPFAPGGKPITGEVYGLVGMHIMVRTKSAPQWIWATFEHVDNGPIVDLRKGVPTKVTGEGKYNFWNAKGTRSFGGFDPGVYQTLSKMPSAPNYYQKPEDRKPSQITRVITDNNSVSDSRWTNHLNEVMQKKLAGTVWENYRLISTQWPSDPTGPGAGNPAPVSLGNPVMETYMQVNGSCMGCHLGSTFGGDDKKSQDANFSFMLQRAQ